jgi:hypothetical protein
LDVAKRMKKSGNGKALASTFADPAVARKWIAEGYRMMNVSSCLALGTQGTMRVFAELREEFGKPVGTRGRASSRVPEGRGGSNAKSDAGARRPGAGAARSAARRS